MHNRSVFQSIAVLIISVATVGAAQGFAQAIEGGFRPAPPATTATTTATAATTAVGSRPAAADATRASTARHEPRHAAAVVGDAYRCHPLEDIACTVVRETAEGTVIVTLLPGGATSPPPAWSVVNGTPPGASAYPGGIIYVVPTTTFDSTSPTRDRTLVTANDAPILD